MSVYSDYRHAQDDEERAFLRGVMKHEARMDMVYPDDEEYDEAEQEEKAYEKSHARRSH